jgi:hypothetical protein
MRVGRWRSKSDLFVGSINQSKGGHARERGRQFGLSPSLMTDRWLVAYFSWRSFFLPHMERQASVRFGDFDREPMGIEHFI